MPRSRYPTWDCCPQTEKANNDVSCLQPRTNLWFLSIDSNSYKTTRVWHGICKKPKSRGRERKMQEELFLGTANQSASWSRVLGLTCRLVYLFSLFVCFSSLYTFVSLP